MYFFIVYSIFVLNVFAGNWNRNSQNRTRQRIKKKPRLKAGLQQAGLCVFWRGKSLVVAVNPLHPFVGFLCFKRHGRNRPRFQALKTDRLAGYFAITVFTLFNTPNRRIDL